MTKIHFKNKTIALNKNESVLDGLLDNGYTIPNACRSGVCQSCLMQASEGQLPEKSQQGLRPALQKQGYFLSCCCYPEQALKIHLPGSSGITEQVKVLDKKHLAHNVIKLTLSRPSSFDYDAGQALLLFKDNEIARNYSLASCPHSETTLELHIKHYPQGQVSHWIANSLTLGHELKIRGPLGHCIYDAATLNDTLLLIGLGTGLAPLLGMVKAAIHHQHLGPIYLYHLADEGDFYLDNELKALSQTARLHYQSVTLDKSDPKAIANFASKVYLQSHAQHIYLAGGETAVKQLQRACFLAGCSMQHIHSDVFHFPMS